MQNDNITKRLEVTNIDAETFKNLLNEMKQSIINEIKEQIHPTTDRYLTREQVAKIFDISTTTVWHWQKAGILKVHKLGNRNYYLESEINKALHDETPTN